MDYNRTSRNQLYESFRQKHQPKGLFFGSDNQELFQTISASGWHQSYDILNKYAELKEGREQDSGIGIEAYLRKYHHKLVVFCTTKAYVEQFYTILRQYNRYPYSRGMGRRTVRTKGYQMSLQDACLLLGDYYRLQFYEVDLSCYLKNEIPEEKLDYKLNMEYYSGIRKLDDIIAAALDAGNRKVYQAIEDSILGENNTTVITLPIIRGMVKCEDKNMHKLLGDFLLAARLQEGVRQAVCENMDCGTETAFLSLFQVVYDNNLIRYSAVKRAVGSWIGLMDPEHTDRIMGKILELMHSCLTSPEEVTRCLHSQDAIEIMVALWCMGSHETTDALSVMRKFLKAGSRQQKLVMSYYNRELCHEAFSNEIAMQAIAGNPDDLELIAAFYSSYMEKSGQIVRTSVTTNKVGDKEKTVIKPIHWNRYFESREEADRHFALLKGVLLQLTGKQKTYAPFLFPWYGVTLSRSDIIEKLCMLACMLDEDEKKDYAAGLLTEVDAGNRAVYVKLLLYQPGTPFQRECLLKALTDREEYTRNAAFQSLNQEDGFGEDEYNKLMEMLRFKNHEIRQNILSLLLKREDGGLEQMVHTLLEDKREEMRLAGLDLILQLRKEGPRKALGETLSQAVPAIREPTERETVLIEQISGRSEAEPEKGYGLYAESDRPCFTSVIYHKEEYPIFSITPDLLKQRFTELDDFIHSHREDRVTDEEGTEHLLGSCKERLPRLIPWNRQASAEEETAFFPLWKEFYQTYVKDFETLYAMYAAVLPLNGNDTYEGGSVWEQYNRKLLGDGVALMDISGYRYGSTLQKSAGDLFGQILASLVRVYREKPYCREISRRICSYLTHEIKDSHRWLKERTPVGVIRYDERGAYYASQYLLTVLAGELKEHWESREEWEEHYRYLAEVDRAYDFDRREKSGGYYTAGSGNSWLNPLDHMKACHLGLITDRQMYYVLFEEMGLRSVLSYLKEIISGKKYRYIRMVFGRFHILEDEPEFDREFYEQVLQTADAITDAVLDIELKRGDIPTEMSQYITYLPPVKGIKRLKQILTALGNDKIVRANLADTKSKSGSLSCILRDSRPAKGETAEELRRQLEGTKITKKRLVETGVYAPAWLELLEAVLEMPGLKSGTYYFMAHMDDVIDDKTAAMIAKYTPLSKEELREGAFDINWFKEVQETLGEEQLALLYDAAKYSSGGSKHTRARKYADAAMGYLQTESVKKEIKEKRNKDLLMALGLIPFQGKEDLLNRYEFIRSFRKESREFGAMRRTSEQNAADMALKNMALAAGYQDVNRLILVMESELTSALQEAFLWQETPEGYKVKLELQGEGKAELLCRKEEKILKTIPAALQKHELVLSLKEVRKKCKEQYQRTAGMMEKSMEDRDAYSLEELQKLLGNLVIGAIISNLVFTQRIPEHEVCGFVTKKGFTGIEGQVLVTAQEALFYVAHPCDLYRSGEWTAFQRRFFQWKAEDKRTQPFRQVFRELYVKLAEEDKSLTSKLFAGNQIQPKRAAACLKGRGWIADYEEGLQKIYYKDNVTARIYALADWFSPSDIEAPTLEWVEFSNRLTFQAIPIGEVPEIIYSEVMRDVDLAVSVAHAGSVDPETSHSTVEMRLVIVACNLELFGITNVRTEGSHALITGKKGEYTIHLGSGVIHQAGGHQINVLPVHSQSRGKLFLPFLDEDPKTAEIVSKILLFARDDKIKDPYILRQLQP